MDNIGRCQIHCRGLRDDQKEKCQNNCVDKLLPREFNDVFLHFLRRSHERSDPKKTAA